MGTSSRAAAMQMGETECLFVRFMREERSEMSLSLALLLPPLLLLLLLLLRNKVTTSIEPPSTAQ
jgi:cytochrome c oxidase subunit IV